MQLIYSLKLCGLNDIATSYTDAYPIVNWLMLIHLCSLTCDGNLYLSASSTNTHRLICSTSRWSWGRSTYLILTRLWRWGDFQYIVFQWKMVNQILIQPYVIVWNLLLQLWLTIHGYRVCFFHDCIACAQVLEPEEKKLTYFDSLSGGIQSSVRDIL